MNVWNSQHSAYAQLVPYEQTERLQIKYSMCYNIRAWIC